MMALILFVMYISYDYIHIRREKDELLRLKYRTQEQRKEIEGLAGRVEQFAARMEELRLFDKKIRIMANLEKGKDREELLGIGGPNPEQNRLRTRLEADDKAIIAGVHQNVERLTDEALDREKSLADLLEHLKHRQSLLAATPSVWPVMGWVTSEFGRRKSPFGNGQEFHKGIDIATRIGQPIQAPADGVIAEVGYQPDLGRMIRIDHGHGISTLYAHLSKTHVRSGKAVRRGERIGSVGNTGRSTGPHLHYTVMLNGIPVNPRKYLN
jgi:murein DD-endopeptidase MepM/ murein hydrolase activator NlpD